jgi:hypothetical protein
LTKYLVKAKKQAMAKNKVKKEKRSNEQKQKDIISLNTVLTPKRKCFHFITLGWLKVN